MRTGRAATTIAATVLAAAALTTTVHAAPGRAAAASCRPSWRLVSLPAPPGSTVAALSDAQMSSATVLSPRDGLFTGTVLNTAFGVPSVLRWDGHVMSQVAFPQFPLGESPLGGASSFDSDTDGWMLTVPSPDGANGDSGLTGYGVGAAERWHGGRWTLTPTALPADPRTAGIELTAVDSFAADNAWAVGFFYHAAEGIVAGVPSTGVAVEHWDGTQWTLAPNPAAAVDGAFLNAVAALSPTDIWAVGTHILDSGQAVPFAEHYDGTAWSIVPVPPGNQNSALYAVSAASANNVWAVGAQTLPGTRLAAPLAEHWDGTAWTVAALPDIGNSRLSGVYAAGDGEVWAGGQFALALPEVFLHWDGARWTTVHVPGPSGFLLDHIYFGMSGSGPDDVWAAGTAVNFGEVHLSPLIAHLSCG